jgi:hypothetical protein
MKDLIATTKANRRRYYLEQKLKDVFNVNTRKKQVSVPMFSTAIPGQKTKWLNELGQTFGYNIQYSIV